MIINKVEKINNRNLKNYINLFQIVSSNVTGKTELWLLSIWKLIKLIIRFIRP